MEAISNILKNALCDRLMKNADTVYRYAAFDIVISPDRPKMQLSEKVCEVLKPEFIAETNAWMLSFFGMHNIIPDGQVYKMFDRQFIMNPRTYLQLKVQLEADNLINRLTRNESLVPWRSLPY